MTSRSIQLPRLFPTFLAAFVLLVISGCAVENKIDGDPSEDQLILADDLDRGIVIHGGIEKWRSFGMLEYDLIQGEKREHHIVDMVNRNVRVEGSTYTIGHNGTDAWVLTDGEEYRGRPRFYSSLYFYFFGMPFVLADPGIHRETLRRLDLDGTSYDRVKISYDSGIGESPDDYYVAHFNTESRLLAFVTYTVTYSSQEPSDNFNAQRYSWQVVDSMRVPKKIDAFYWEEESESFGDKRGEAHFENVTFSESRPDNSLFTVPEGAVVDPRN